jgi:putative toxin-antitoxin system antitoxin component (TIGR02293 family)
VKLHGSKSFKNTLGGAEARIFEYRPAEGVDAYVRRIGKAEPLQMIALERSGVQGRFVKDLAVRMKLPTSRFFEVLGVPKASAERKAASGKKLTGSGGQAVIAMTRLINLAEEIVAASTSSDANSFDATRWLGEWIERPQAALGGRRPSELLDTPTGFSVVSRLLGSLSSGSYQ